MTITALLVSGVELMLVGMGIVFLFLAMLIGAIRVMANLVERFFPEVSVIIEKPVDSSHVAAISAAVHQYRIKHK